MAVARDPKTASSAALPVSVPVPIQGVIRLWALRWALVVLLSLPALLAAVGGMAMGAARMPYFSDVEGRMPVIHLVLLLRELPKAFAPALFLTVALVVLADQVLMGGALALFDPGRAKEGRVKVFSTVCREGLPHLWAFLRAAGLGVVISAIGVSVLRALMDRISTAGQKAGWTGATMVLTLPLLTTLLSLVWLASVGAWVFWVRLMTAADGRRRVRRTGLLAVRVLARSPLRAWGMFVALTLASMLVSGAVLVAWRQAEPRSGVAIALWTLAFLITLGAQAFVWVWLLRGGRLLYASDRYADVRGRPDDAFGIWARLRFWRRKPAPAPKVDEAATSNAREPAPRSSARAQVVEPEEGSPPDA